MTDQDRHAEDEATRTWHHWQLNPTLHEELGTPLISRAEVLATVARLGAQPPVDERTLRYWEAEGIIPRPTLDYSAGGDRTRYPWWVVDLILLVRLYQSHGLTIAQLPGRMRAEARVLSMDPLPRPTVLARATDDGLPLGARVFWQEMAPYADAPRRPSMPPFRELEVPAIIRRQLVETLSELGALCAHHYNLQATRAEVRLLPDNGEGLTFPVVLDQHTLVEALSSLKQPMVDEGSES